MSQKRSPRRMLRALAIASGATLVSASMLPTTVATPAESASQAPAAGNQAQSFTDGNYIVVMAAAPSASYTGGEVGLAATKPEKGDRLDVTAAEVKAYEEHLTSVQEQTASEVGIEIRQSYSTVLNGFSASLTGDQAAQLALSDKVAHVLPDETVELTTVHSPEYLGLAGPKGVWRKFGTPKKAGEGVVVGVIDTGINTNNASFAGDPMPAERSSEKGKPSMDADGNVHMVKANGQEFRAICQEGENFKKSDCNDKIIAAQYFADGYNSEIPEDKRNDEMSPRDTQTHGSHVAGTAAGNWNVPVTIDGVSFGKASGMAPAAKISSYKAFYTRADHPTAAAVNSDIVAAIDQAVADGVDVINYSAQGSRDNPIDPTMLSFLNASSAGVFVAAAAGNVGKDAVVRSGAPWVTTVGSSTFHNYEGTVVAGDDQKFLGASVTAGALPDQTPAIHARDAAAEGANADDAARCFENTLDEAKAKGKVVVCDRGVIARVDKSKESKRAGAVGTVLRNMEPGTLDADVHSIPTVHINEESGKKLGEYLNTDNPTLAFTAGNTSDEKSPVVPVLADSSSRGPSQMAGGNILKPDIAAPGVNVVAALHEEDGDANRFGPRSGTSMATPHIAGLAALMFSKYPKWSPMMVKSAMMTTTKPLLTADGKTDTSAFTGGAGQVNPPNMVEPGLVYDSGLSDWLGFLAGQGKTDLAEPIRAVDLNNPSIAIADLAVTETVTRRLTAVKPGTYTPKFDLAGFDAKVEPATLEFSAAGQEREVKITLTRTDAPLDKYAFGSLTWTGAGTDTRIPLAVRPRQLRTPAATTVKAGVPEASIAVTAGVDKTQQISVSGLVEGERHTGSLKPGAPTLVDPGNDNNKMYKFTVPEDTALTVVDLLPGKNATDLNLFLVNSQTQFLPDSSAGFSSKAGESIKVRNLPAGEYRVVVNCYKADDDTGDYDLRIFNLPEGDAGNMTVTPNPVELKQGKEEKLQLKMSDLDADKVYLGELSYDGLPNRTIVNVG